MKCSSMAMRCSLQARLYILFCCYFHCTIMYEVSVNKRLHSDKSIHCNAYSIRAYGDSSLTSTYTI